MSCKSVLWEPNYFMRTDGRTGIMWLIVTFHNFTKAPKNVQHEKCRLVIGIITALPTFSQNNCDVHSKTGTTKSLVVEM
jgi:hypothetical protein